MKFESFFGFVPIQLSESNTTEIEIMRKGSWNHPSYGKINITDEALDGFIKSFNDKVRGVDLAVDLEHGVTDQKGAAAGWFKGIKKVGDRLLATVEWTELGIESIKSGKYKYFSPEFRFSYKDPETNKEHKNVLFGGGLTNRPFIKNMQPVLLSEEMANEVAIPVKNKEVKKMTLSKEVLAKLSELTSIKLSEESDEAVIQSAIVKLSESVVTLTDDNKKLKDTNTALAEDNAKLKGDTTKLSDTISKIELKLKETDWSILCDEAMKEGKMTKPMADELKKRYLSDPEGTKTLISLLQPTIVMHEVGSSRGSKSNVVMFEQKIQEVLTANKGMTYAEAAIVAERQNPDLFKAMNLER